MTFALLQTSIFNWTQSGKPDESLTAIAAMWAFGLFLEYMKSQLTAWGA
eukprot:CAMPEP_0169162378 /NCGR_PEP_ID=MMETSP1015-20121227/57614_1 /TAXON_ID=342587 /ORGANISM="Karlodinium micrum, Strain CCMP2283" /LENGTH=48 /DNA_ID= /DNA_START= /DNA_END= /DNA_ORIENTATION=